MQELLFEASWEKALSTQDRQNIEDIFNETKHFSTSDLLFSTLRVAINHKEALLVTVLVHNFSNQLLTFNNAKVSYYIEGECIAERTFTLSALAIPSKVSMPWTFIFPKGNYIARPSYENGRLEI
ncbi:SLAP domain-containing protein [Lysinibacillus sp. BW-2-10]|uniref:SLAP domain-containing protein n=1 Tax=Lysinibacillus sp. BW-2-10 TaxID=2590030 RepID=UPI00117ECDED|nr:SLAP domain-containing protein [Lysinibacillus sp. BW-2-10]TSI02558.1 SLAP domain-containing protein [Lysinibacillus sp. BW-2-10]